MDEQLGEAPMKLTEKMPAHNDTHKTRYFWQCGECIDQLLEVNGRSLKVIGDLEKRAYMFEKLYNAERITKEREIKRLQKEVNNLKSLLGQKEKSK